MRQILFALIHFAFLSTASGSEWSTETLFDAWRQSIRIDEKLYEEHSEHQDLLIFHNRYFGKVLVLDGVVQTTEFDEFVYHETFVHVPLIAHGHVKRVLVFGGGDGGAIREVLKHKTVEKVTLVEIDADVIAFSKKHLPFLSRGSFEDSRLEVIIEDGAIFAKECKETFDVIICDSPDPEGPGLALFSSEFFGNCQKLLSEGGIFVNQSGVPFVQSDELIMVHKNLKEHFQTVRFFVAPIPTYVGGFMAFGFATNADKTHLLSAEEVKKRMEAIEGTFKYYTPSIHNAAFALPKYIEDYLNR